MIHKIISGGQTGVDQAALDVARQWAIPYGGWIPKGRKTEAGPLSPDVYDQMQEMPTDDYAARTEQNVVDSDATLILCRGDTPTGGTQYTLEMARDKHQKPVLVVDLSSSSSSSADQTTFEMASEIVNWIEEHNIKRLNVAGPRASKDPKIYSDAVDLLTLVLSHLG